MAVPRKTNQDGVALITVMIGSLAALALSMAMLTFATGSLSSSQNTEAYGAALAGTEAGVDDFLYRLNRDTNYWKYATTTGALPLPGGQTNDALTTGKGVPGGDTNEKYTYKVTDPPTATNKGTLTLQVTGESRGSKRTLKATIRRAGFLDYLYFTDYETRDPALYGAGDTLTPAQAEAQCKVYAWAPGGRPSACVNLVFGTADVVNGPLHSNDTIRTSSDTNNKPEFLGETTSNKPTAPRWIHSGSGYPRFLLNPVTASVAADRGPRLGANLKMPPSNSSIKAEAKIGTSKGCLYTGPTRFWFLANGKFRVRSPLTASTNTGCGPVDASADVALPADFNGVIYVQGVPTNPTDPNYSTFCNTSTNYPTLSHPTSPAPTYNILPTTNKFTGDLTTYSCNVGDAFVQGTVKGAFTVAAQNNIVVMNDLIYEGSPSPYTSIPATNTNVMGLVADNFVQIFHPVNGSGTNLTTELSNVKVHAAILSVKHVFHVQKWNTGGTTGLGTMTILGAIAQTFRGAVGTSNSAGTTTNGFTKNYIYDTRLKVISPPHFIDPVQSAWQVNKWAEVKNP